MVYGVDKWGLSKYGVSTSIFTDDPAATVPTYVEE